MKKTILRHVLVIAAIFLLLFLLIGNLQKSKRLNKAYKAANSEMVKYKNKYGQEVAKVKVIETARRKDFFTMESQDATIKKLQKLVKQTKPETAIIIETVTKVDTFTIIDTNGYFDYTDEWIELIGQTIKDSLTFNLIVKNEFNLIEKKEYLEITNLNPYTSTENLRIYKDIPRKKRIVVGAGIGAGIGYDVLTNKPTLNGGVYIGIFYKLFEF